MNFLGHIYLSGSDPEIMLGNYSGDFIKGRAYQKYPEKFQLGVKIHRSIDSYTDKHPIVHELNKLFQVKYHKYAGVIVDVAFDHMLTQTWPLFSLVSLDDFMNNIHSILQDNINELPLKAQKIVPSFIEKKWVQTYHSLSGLELVYSRMAIRTSLPAYSGFAVRTIRENYALFLDQFVDFFRDIIVHINKKYGIEFTLPPID